MQIERMDRKEIMDALLEAEEKLENCTLNLQKKIKLISRARASVIIQRDTITRLVAKRDALRQQLDEPASQDQQLFKMLRGQT